MMTVTRKDPLTGKENTLELDITEQQLDKWRNGGRNIQVVMPQLSADHREFLMTGLMPDSWESIFDGTKNVPRGEGN